jgi:hypothetical protein
LHILFNLLLRCIRAKTSDRVVVQFKLGPDNEVYDIWINAIGPVVVQDFNVLCIPSDKFAHIIMGCIPGHSNGLPFGSMLSHCSRSLTMKFMILPYVFSR